MHQACGSLQTPDQSTRGDFSQPSSFTVSRAREAHNFSSWGGGGYQRNLPAACFVGQEFAELGRESLKEFQRVSEGFQHLH